MSKNNQEMKTIQFLRYKTNIPQDSGFTGYILHRWRYWLFRKMRYSQIILLALNTSFSVYVSYLHHKMFGKMSHCLFSPTSHGQHLGYANENINGVHVDANRVVNWIKGDDCICRMSFSPPNDFLGVIQ